ncbi:hypothetical protein V3N95_11940 (plasmid) [Micrococcaceae bacterium Sec6.3]
MTTTDLPATLRPFTCACGQLIDPTAHSFSFDFDSDEHLHCADLAALAALEADRRRAHALIMPAAHARTRYKRFVRRGGCATSELIEAMDEAVRLSCERRNLLERIATDSAALARKVIPGHDQAALLQRADDDRAALEACDDVDRLRI